MTDDPGVKDALGFLMTREVAHQISIEKYANAYYNMSAGGEVRGSWNSDENFQYIAEPSPAVDGGDGTASVQLLAKQQAAVDALTARTVSDPEVNPVIPIDLLPTSPGFVG